MTETNLLQKTFKELNQTVLALKERDSEMTRKYGGLLLLENILDIPADVNKEVLAEKLVSDGMVANVTPSGIMLTYRKKEN